MDKVHDTREAARAALGAAGYKSGFASPGRPELWIKGQSRVAVARRVLDADESWVVLPYPEPATATPAQAIDLAKRDGIVLNGGKLVNEPDMAVLPPSDVLSHIDAPEVASDPDADLL